MRDRRDTEEEENEKERRERERDALQVLNTCLSECGLFLLLYLARWCVHLCDKGPMYLDK